MGTCNESDEKKDLKKKNKFIAKMNENNNVYISKSDIIHPIKRNNYNETNDNLNETNKIENTNNKYNKEYNEIKNSNFSKLSNNNINNQSNFNNNINLNNGLINNQISYRVKIQNSINSNLDSNNKVSHNVNVNNSGNNLVSIINTINLNNHNMNNRNIINQSNNLPYNQSIRLNDNNCNIIIRQYQSPNNNIQRIKINQNTIYNQAQQNQNLNNRLLVSNSYNNNNQNNNRRSNISNSGSRNNDFWHRIDSRNSQNMNNNANHNRNENYNSINSNNRNYDPFDQLFEDDFFTDFFNNTNNEHVSQSPINAQRIHIRINGNGSINIGQSNINSDDSPFEIHINDFRINYLSNFDRQFLNEMSRILSSTENERGENSHPPTSENALNNLKRFPLSEKHCKKNNGKMELPNCCICQNEIELGNETVLLPCGHMYHWECCLQWLKTNNTCPICRFEIK